MLAVLATLLVGCGDVPVAARQPAKKRPSATTATQLPASLPVTQETFASVDAAMAEVEKIASTDGENDSQKLRQIETWLNMQGAAIAPDLAARINDPAAGLATRLTACRVLARQGPVATPALLQAIEQDEQPQLRIKAIESLGRVKPPSAQAVQKLVSLLEHEDYDVCKAALTGLKSIGPAVKEHEPEIVATLMAKLNDVNEDETVRSLTKQALMKIDPRRGLQNAH
jgi:HEAT repeat protein